MQLVATLVLFVGVPLGVWLFDSRSQWKARAIAAEAELADAREAARALSGVVESLCSCHEPEGRK